MSLYHNNQVEWEIIGSCLIKPSLIQSVVTQLESKHFISPKARLFFRLISETYNSNNDLNIFLDEFLARIKSQNLLQQIPFDSVFGLIGTITSTIGLNSFIKELQETAVRVQLGGLVTTLSTNLGSRHILVDDSIKAIIDCLNSLDGQVRMPSTPSNLCKEFVEQSEGIFTLNDIYRQYQIFDRENKQRISRVLSRMVEDEIIKRESNRNGVFRRIERGVDVVDWESATGETIEFNCPLGADRYASLHRKSVVVVGGSKDAGKTSYAENFALMNIGNFEQIRYVTSEMGADELRDSLQRFEGVPLETWKQIEFIERHRDFADVVLPNGLTVIDFLDVVEDFFMVIKYMKEIYDELNTGIALVCLQKDPGKDFSRGGAGSEDKARLAIHLKQDYPGYEAKINVGKIWAQKGVNPKGFTRRYRLVNDGSRFIGEGGWCSP